MLNTVSTSTKVPAKSVGPAVADLLDKARELNRQGQWQAAREAYAQVLKLDSNLFEVWYEVGQLCVRQSVPQQAVAAFRRALQLDPASWQAHVALASALEDAGQPQQAGASYHQAIMVAAQSKQPTSQVHWAISQSRKARANFAGALEALRQCIAAFRVEQPQPHVNEQAHIQLELADLLMNLGLQEWAHRAFEKASSATDENLLARLAQTSLNHNLWQESIAVLRRSVELHPKSDQARWNLANTLSESWHLDEAQTVLDEAIRLGPQPQALNMRASIMARTGRASEALDLYQQQAQTEPVHSPVRSSVAMCSLYCDQLKPAEVAKLHHDLFNAWGLNSRDPKSFKNDRNPARRLRVGFVSPDMHHQHPVNLFMQPLLANFDHESLELWMYHTGEIHDAQTHLARSRVHHWVPAKDFDAPQFARRIEADQIDVLVDLSGHTSNNRLVLFAQRLAPVQVSFLGYPGSTGMPNMDWIVADHEVAPEQNDSLFSEQVYRLPNTVFCYAPDPQQYPLPEWGALHAERPLTFGSFNNVSKLTTRTLVLWAQVLKAVPNSRLVLKAPTFQNQQSVVWFTQRFVEFGIDPARLEFRGPVGLVDMMAEYADIDIALDTTPYNGGTTTLQALWMGVPVLTLQGQNFVSRMGASFMKAAKLADWVATTDDQFVELAISHAADRSALLELKKGLRGHLQRCPAWDAQRYTRDFEAGLRHMWAAFCRQTH